MLSYFTLQHDWLLSRIRFSEIKSIKEIILKILLISIVILSLVIIISAAYSKKENSIAIKNLILPEQGGPPLIETLGWGLGFSAQMVIKDGGKISCGKILFQSGKMRQEFQDDWGQTITIVRPDKKIVWVILAQNKTYLELALKDRYPGQFIQMPPDALEKHLLGTETVSGFLADKYEVIVRKGEKGVERQTLWMARQLGVPIKVSVKNSSFSIEYRNIKEGTIADRLFEPPTGFKKTTQLISFANKVRGCAP